MPEPRLRAAGGPFVTIALVEDSTPGETPSLEAIERALGDAERALERLAEGEYDACEVCGEPIGDELLSRSPLSRRCERHPGPVAPGGA